MKNKKILVIGLIVILISILYMPNTFGTVASVSLKASNNNPNAGESVTVTASAVAGGFNLTLSGNGETKQIVGQTDTTDNVSKTASITFTAEEGKTYTFNLTGDYTDFYKDDATSVNEKVTVTVKAKAEEKPKQETPSEQTPATPTNTGTTEKPKQEEPDFTGANMKMYASDGMNLRASWSTSSEKTYIKKGTELTVTATSTKRVNDYIWYRVSYDGQTKYAASNLLTSTNPIKEEEKEEEEEKKEETPTEQKSNNANLKTLTVEGQELIPGFAPNVTSYTVQVPKEITKIEIKAEPEDSKSTVSVKGNDALSEDGESLATVSVSAENGTIKIYEIKVEKVSEEVRGLGLKSLKIDGTDINSKFKPNIYNYEINIEQNVTDLKIEAVANEETATVEILGNENFQDGENLITIIVSSQDGENKVTYQIKANRKKQAVQTSSGVKTEKQPANHKMYLYIGIAAVVLIALIIVVIYTVKHRNSDEEEHEVLPDKLPEKKIEKDDDNEVRKKGKHF